MFTVCVYSREVDLYPSFIGLASFFSYVIISTGTVKCSQLTPVRTGDAPRGRRSAGAGSGCFSFPPEASPCCEIRCERGTLCKALVPLCNIQSRSLSEKPETNWKSFLSVERSKRAHHDIYGSGKIGYLPNGHCRLPVLLRALA